MWFSFSVVLFISYKYKNINLLWKYKKPLIYYIFLYERGRMYVCLLVCTQIPRVKLLISHWKLFSSFLVESIPLHFRGKNSSLKIPSNLKLHICKTKFNILYDCGVAALNIKYKKVICKITSIYANKQSTWNKEKYLNISNIYIIWYNPLKNWGGYKIWNFDTKKFVRG